jgi:hypothetical protein
LKTGHLETGNCPHAQALGGRDAVGLLPLLRFLVRHTANPRHSALCTGLAHRWVRGAVLGACFQIFDFSLFKGVRAHDVETKMHRWALRRLLWAGYGVLRRC